LFGWLLSKVDDVPGSGRAGLMFQATGHLLTQSDRGSGDGAGVLVVCKGVQQQDVEARPAFAIREDISARLVSGLERGRLRERATIPTLVSRCAAGGVKALTIKQKVDKGEHTGRYFADGGRLAGATMDQVKPLFR
jgi:hypothetical protein